MERPEHGVGLTYVGHGIKNNSVDAKNIVPVSYLTEYNSPGQFFDDVVTH